MLEVLGIKHADKLVPLPEDHKPTDPVTENMSALKGEPLKAFIYQDHESHIAVHQAAMTDPIVQQLIGQNPQAQQIMASMQAHIAEHVGFAYRQKIEKALGVSLPNPEDTLPPEIENQVSRLMAQAAGQVLQESKAHVAQQQAQQNQQDPILQIQMQELQLKQQELDIKKRKMMADVAAKADEIHLKQMEIMDKNRNEQTKLGMQAGKDKQNTQLEGARLGVDVAKHKAQMQAQMQAQVKSNKGNE